MSNKVFILERYTNPYTNPAYTPTFAILPLREPAQESLPKRSCPKEPAQKSLPKKSLPKKSCPRRAARKSLPEKSCPKEPAQKSLPKRKEEARGRSLDGGQAWRFLPQSAENWSAEKQKTGANRRLRVTNNRKKWRRNRYGRPAISPPPRAGPPAGEGVW